MKKNKEKAVGVDKKKPPVSKIIIIVVSIFLALVTLFGVTLGLIVHIRNKNAVVYYDGLTMNEEVASFFASYYKSLFISQLMKSGVENVSDTIDFWYTEYEEGKTYKDALTEGTKAYLKEIMVANYLFDNYTSLTSEGKSFIQKVVDEVVEYKSGSIKSFNEAVKPYGFSYNSFKDASTMLYKATKAKDVIYGQAGANLQGSADLCEEYLDTYTHVKLLFIRTETEFVVDEDGNRVLGDDGYETRPLSESEILERVASIESIRKSILAYENGTDGQMSPEYFDSMLKKYDVATDVRHAYGYYFNEHSNYTVGFAESISDEVVKKAFSMENNSYAEVELDFGICFIYRYDCLNGAYALSALDTYFDDFYEDCATYFFDKSVKVLAGDVDVREKFNDIYLTVIPYNSIFVPRF